MGPFFIHYLQRVGSFSYITEGGVILMDILICYRGWGHTEGGVIYIHCGGGVIHIHCTEGGLIHIHSRGCGHSHTLQRVGSFTYIAGGETAVTSCLSSGDTDYIPAIVHNTSLHIS